MSFRLKGRVCQPTAQYQLGCSRPFGFDGEAIKEFKEFEEIEEIKEAEEAETSAQTGAGHSD
ncbi:MAG: hypothetical protein LBR26_14090 [Prevotella sp.]|jgi:hypothetical protein|nr:hypothetical protein [Prevotella sp.]